MESKSQSQEEKKKKHKKLVKVIYKVVTMKIMLNKHENLRLKDETYKQLIKALDFKEKMDPQKRKQVGKCYHTSLWTIIK